MGAPHPALIAGAICIGIGYIAGYNTHHTPKILSCEELEADTWAIVDKRLAEKARIDAGKPIEKSWFSLPDNRRSLDLAHMRDLGCDNIPTY